MMPQAGHLASSGMEDLWASAVRSRVSQRSRSAPHVEYRQEDFTPGGALSPFQLNTRNASPSGVSRFSRTGYTGRQRSQENTGTRTAVSSPRSRTMTQPVPRSWGVTQRTIQAQAPVHERLFADASSKQRIQQRSRAQQRPRQPPTPDRTVEVGQRMYREGIERFREQQENIKREQELMSATQPPALSPVSRMIMSRKARDSRPFDRLSATQPPPTRIDNEATFNPQINSLSRIIEDIRTTEGSVPPRLDARMPVGEGVATTAAEGFYVRPEEVGMTPHERREARLMERIQYLWDSEQRHRDEMANRRVDELLKELEECTPIPPLNPHSRELVGSRRPMTRDTIEHTTQRLYKEAAVIQRIRESKNPDVQSPRQRSPFKARPMPRMSEPEPERAALPPELVASESPPLVVSGPQAEGAARIVQEQLFGVSAPTWATISREYIQRRSILDLIRGTTAMPILSLDGADRQDRSLKVSELRSELAHSQSITAAAVAEVAAEVDRELEMMPSVPSIPPSPRKIAGDQ